MRPLSFLLLIALLPPLAWAVQPWPITGAESDYDPLLVRLNQARIILLGEATHGSREFYRERARISQRLIDEQNVTALIFEAPWAAMRRLDRYINGATRDVNAAAALTDFRHFPRWLWRNEEIRVFAERLKKHNHIRQSQGLPPVRVYGMDLYGLPEAIDAVVHYLARHSVSEAAAARAAFACFMNFEHAPERYGAAVERQGANACAPVAEHYALALQPDDDRDEERFAAWMSARSIVAAERYFRALYRSDQSSWNERECFLAETVDLLLARHGKAVVWAQNIHQGDARATDQAQVGELSLGQLMRERHGTATALVGLTTHRGWVRAASGWGGTDRVRRLRPALPDSVAGQLHHIARQTKLPAFLLIFDSDAAAAKHFATSRLDRYVGVSYLPHDERRSHYMHGRAAEQFDVLLHIDRTTALPALP